MILGYETGFRIEMSIFLASRIGPKFFTVSFISSLRFNQETGPDMQP